MTSDMEVLTKNNVAAFRKFTQEIDAPLEEHTSNNGDVFFEGRQNLENGPNIKVFIVFAKGREFVDIYLGNYVTISNPLKRDLYYQLITELNCDYRFTRFVLNGDNKQEIGMKTALDFEGNFEPRIVWRQALSMVEAAQEELPKFMKILWS